MITIREVAKAADVSISTVSRVINNSPNVTREKRNRVLAAIEAVGYVPNVKPKEPEVVEQGGKVILVITTIFHASLCPAIEENAREQGYDVLFKYTGEYDGGIEKALSGSLWKEVLKPEMLGGIILLNPSMIRELYSDPFLSQYPVVQVGCSMKNYGGYTVSTDDFQAAYDMTAYLVSCGYKRIAFVSTNDNIDASRYSFARERYYGYHRALKDAGVAAAQEQVIYCDLSAKGGREAAAQILGMDPSERPDAVFCMADRIAFGLTKALLDAGVRIPEDMGVVGFDGVSEGEDMTPALTTLVQAFDDIGAEAVQMLDQVIRGEISNGRKLLVAHHLAIRETTRDMH